MAKKQSSKNKREHTDHCVSYPIEEYERTRAKLSLLPIKWIFFRHFFFCSTAFNERIALQ